MVVVDKTLMQLLKTQWDDYPEEYQRVYQDEEGCVIGSNGWYFRDVITKLPVIASDRDTAVITKTNWNKRS